MANKKAIFGSKVSFQERHFTAQEEDRFSYLEQKVHNIDRNLRRFSPSPIRRDSPYPSPQRYPNDNNWSYRSPTRNNDGMGRPRNRDYNRGYQGRTDGNYRYSPTGNRNVQPRYQSPSQPRYQSLDINPLLAVIPLPMNNIQGVHPNINNLTHIEGIIGHQGIIKIEILIMGVIKMFPNINNLIHIGGIIGQHGIIRIEMLRVMGITKIKITLQMHIYRKPVARKGKAVMIEKTLIRHKPDKPREAQV